MPVQPAPTILESRHPDGWAYHCLLLFLLSFAALLAAMDRHINPYDEGIVLVDAMRVLDGDVIHRDFYSLYGPGQYFALAGLFKIFGASVLVERLWDTAVRAMTVVLVLCIVERVATRTVGWMTALVCIPWLARFGFYGYPVFPALDAAFASVLCVIPVLHGVRSWRRLALAGFFVGVASLFRYDAGIVMSAVLGLTLGVCAVCDGDRGGSWTARLASVAVPFAVGFGVIIGPLAAAYLLAGAGAGFVFDFIVFPPANYAATRSLPFPGLADFRHSSMTFAVYLPLLACLAAVVVAVRLRVHRELPSIRWPLRGSVAAYRWTLLLLAMVTLALFFKGVVRVSLIHMAMGIVPALVLIPVTVASWPLADRVSRILAGATLLIAFEMTLGAVSTAEHSLRANLAWAMSGQMLAEPAPDGVSPAGACRMPARFQRLACFIAPAEVTEAIGYLRDRITPGERIFVGAGRHDKIFADNLMFYFLAEAQPATHWHQFDPGLQTTARVQNAIVAELEQARPTFVIIDQTWDTVMEPNASANSSGVTILDRYIASRYTLARRFGPISVLTRGTPAGPAAQTPSPPALVGG